MLVTDFVRGCWVGYKRPYQEPAHVGVFIFIFILIVLGDY